MKKYVPFSSLRQGQSLKENLLESSKLLLAPLNFSHSTALVKKNTFYSESYLLDEEKNNFASLLFSLKQDVFTQILKRPQFNRFLKNAFFEEFLKTESSLTWDFHFFWNTFFHESWEKEHGHPLFLFFQRYSEELTYFYLYKLIFLKNLAKKFFDIPLRPQNINSFIPILLKKGTPKEIGPQALGINIFSWYTPSDFFLSTQKLLLTKFWDSLDSTTLSSLQHYKKNSQTQKKENTSSLFIRDLFSSLLPFFGHSFKSSFSYLYLKGDFVENISKDLLSLQTSRDHTSLTFIPKFLHEQQRPLFALFEQSLEALSLILENCDSMEDFYHEAKTFLLDHNEDSKEVLSFFEKKKFSCEKHYAFLSALSLPKTNSLHWLLQEIINISTHINEEGFLLVQTSQKIFLPSHADKIIGLCETLSPVFCFDFSSTDLNHKNIGPYFYCFKKITVKNTPIFPHFSLKGSFEQDHFETIFHSFLETTNLCSLLPLPYTKIPITQNFHMEMFKETLLEGKLFSFGKDSSLVFPPNFFPNLSNNCCFLKDIFQIEPIRANSPVWAPYVLAVITDYTKPLLVKFLTKESYHHIVALHGRNNCYYFALTPTGPLLGIEGLEIFFSDPIGKHFLQFCLIQDPSYLKAGAIDLFFPKFLVEEKKSYEISQLITLSKNLNQEEEKHHRLFASKEGVMPSTFEEFLFCPFSMDKLTSLTLLPIQKHPNFYLEYSSDFSQEIVFLNFLSQEKCLYCFNQNKEVILKMHCEDALAKFIQVLLYKALPLSLEQVLENFYLPLEEHFLSFLSYLENSYFEGQKKIAELKNQLGHYFLEALSQ